MNISSLFIKRPVMTTLVMIAIVIFGVVSYRLLPVSDLPSVDYPTISVSASLPGASPETMASAVATPLEKRFSTIAGVDVMTSTSGQGSTNITLQFTLDRDIDAAAQDVQAAISQTLRQLPDGIIPPSYRKVDPSASAILYFAMWSDAMPLAQLDEYAETYLAQRISTVPGVAQVNVFGSATYAVHVQLDPQALAARKIGIDEVVGAVSGSNVNRPTGILWGTDKVYTVQANGQLPDAAAFRPLIVAYRDGAPVRLQDLGNVVDGIQNDKSATWFNGHRAIVLAVQRQPGTNTVAVAGAVRKAMAEVSRDFPPSVRQQMLYDRSVSIQESVHDVKFTLFVTLSLVVLVIFLFLRNLSATVIPSLALPMSLIGTFIVMYALGYSLDNLSLMALTLSVGFVVDDAIVMLENIVRHIENGESVLTAAFRGSREIGFTILSMTISLVAVFIPILFLGGLVGRLFHEFAVTIGAAILVSGFVSLTLTPMLCSRFLKPSKREEHGRFYQATERVYERALGGYMRSLEWAMNRRPLMMLFSAIILVGTIVLGMVVPKGFLPSEDNGHISGTTEMAEGTSYQAMVEHQQQLADIVAHDPNVEAYMSFVGAGGRSSTINNGRLVMHLKPRSERDMNIDEVIRELNKKLSVVPGIRVFLTNPPPINIGGRSSKSLYQFTLQGPDIDELYTASQALEARLRDLPELEDVTSDLQIKSPQVDVQIDRDRAASLGISVDQIESALYDAYGARQVSTIFTQNNQYWVIMELEPQYQRDLSALNLLYIHSATGELVPLASLARVTESIGPLTVNHSGQLPSVTLSFNIAEGVALGTAVSKVQQTARAMLPSSITPTFSGTAQAFQQAQSGLLVLLVLAIFVIYVVLGILYESFIHPLTILSGLPFAGFGALLTLLIFRTELSVYAFVGIIMLIGLVKKNAIMMIDFAIDAERNEGKPARQAIIEACRVRFRPIMMTTMAALMGTLPIALGTGAGAESRRPLGIAVVGGLAFSQFITLYITPVVYTYLDGLQRRVARRVEIPEAEAAIAASPAYGGD
ncbi:MAG TPA: multidrug efflux RND transporter permease subunit [Gemmatimonadaceae bacterium]|nr:multidrug efflux RND transporter permease subunit [Gemmatimonadaceae bacterium]